MELLSRLRKAWQRDSMALHLGLIAAAALVVWGATCGLWSLGGSDETRYTMVARDLLENGNVFLLTLNGELYDQKPPLVFWLFAVALKLCGGEVNSFAPRMVSVLFAVLMLGCTYICGRRLLSAKAGLYGAFILATCPVFMNYAPKAKLDMVFAAFITLAISAVISRQAGRPVGWLRALAIWGGLAGAFFAKGPLALVIVLLFMLFYVAVQKKQWWRALRQLRFFWGLALVFALIAVWLAIEVHLAGPSFVTKQVGGETLDRVLQGDHGNPLWFYFVNIFGIIGVWTIALITAIVMLVKRKAPLPPNLRLWLFWFGPGFVLLCLASGKRTSYMLPLLPPLVLFIGYYINYWSQKTVAKLALKITAAIFTKICLALGAVMCLTSVVVFCKMSLAWGQGFYVTKSSLLCTFIIGLLLVWAGRRKSANWGGLSATLIMVMMLANFFNNTVVYPATDVHRTSRYFSQNLTLMFPELLQKPLGAVAKSGEGIAVQNVYGHRFHIYGKYKTVPVFFEPDMFAGCDSQLPDFILMHEKDFRQLTTPPEAGGFSMAFWDRLEDKYNLVLLHREAAPLTLAEIYPRAVPAALGLHRVNPAAANIYSIDMRQGLAANAYAVNWLMRQGQRFPAEHNLLVLVDMPKRLPSGRAFNKWLLNALVENNKIEGAFFSGNSIDVAVFLKEYALPVHSNRKGITKLWLNLNAVSAYLLVVYTDGSTEHVALSGKASAD